MSGAGLRIDVNVDDRELRRVLRNLRLSVRDLTPVMREIGGMLVASTLDRFERGTAPDGSDWQKSARAEAEHGQTLIDTGRLRDSITHRASNDAVEVGTNVIYAAIHQFGGRIEAKKKNRKAVTMPARPFLGLSHGDREAIVRLVSRKLEQAMQ